MLKVFSLPGVRVSLVSNDCALHASAEHLLEQLRTARSRGAPTLPALGVVETPSEKGNLTEKQPYWRGASGTAARMGLRSSCNETRRGARPLPTRPGATCCPITQKHAKKQGTQKGAGGVCENGS
eukprot:scaffold42332_cov63-Phaeocystis_antarctica.AAC.9